MSFILEAQRRENSGVMADLEAPSALPGSTGRGRWALWLIGIALIVNAGIVGYLFGPWAPNKAQQRVVVSAPDNPKATRALVVKPRERTGPTNAASGPSAAARSRSATPIETVQPTVRPRSIPPSPVATAPAAQPPANLASRTGKGRVLSPEQAAALNIALPEAAIAAPETPTESASTQALAQRSAAVTERERKKVPSSATAAKAPIRLEQLSAADRADFPELEFSTHVFADDPSLRAVVVNSRRLSEGENIGEMVLRAVTEDGIVVDYRGQRVAVSVVETWNE